MDDSVIRYQKRRDVRMKKRADAFEEGKHKRDENGRFVSTGGSEKNTGKKSFADLKKQYERDMSTTKKLTLTEDEIYELSKDPKMRKRMARELLDDYGN